MVVQASIIKSKGQKTEPSSFRGISLLCCLSKMLTGIVYHRLQKCPSWVQMVISQDSARFLQKLPILQDLAEKWQSFKTWQKMVILQHLPEKLVYCKFVPVELSSNWLSFMQHISFWPELCLRISYVFLITK